MEDGITPENGSQAEQKDATLDLNFVPDWARKPPENPYAGRDFAAGDPEGRPRGRRMGGRNDERRGNGGDRNFRRGDRRDGDRRDGGRGRMEHRGGERGGPRGPGGGAGEERRSTEGRGDVTGHREGRREGRPDGERRTGGGGHHRTWSGERQPRELLPRMDVKVSFLPDRDRLTLVVRDIQASRRAFPLIEIANRFLGRDDLYQVKLELPPPKEGETRKTFAQCLACQRVFLSRANAEAHVLDEHLDKFFDVEEVETEAPSGTYSCVARCRLSGVLLGPPNDHSYNQKLQELWSTRFSHMPKSEYLSHIETVRDEALVEQWKESMRKKTVYRLKAQFLPKTATAVVPAPAETPASAASDEAPTDGAVENAPAAEAPATEAPAVETAPAIPAMESPAMTRQEAQDWMRSRVNGLLRESARSLLPGAQSRKFDDPSLRREVSMAWQRETRFPFTLSLALRPAFRRMRLFLFKINARETYVTAVAPSPVDLTTAPDIVKQIVAFLEANPGASRAKLLEGLRPGLEPESKEASEVLLHLGHLIANGGLIEFFNGTLGLPRAPVEKSKTDETAGAKTEVPASAGEHAPETTEENLESASEEKPAPAAEATEKTAPLPETEAKAEDVAEKPAPVEEKSEPAAEAPAAEIAPESPEEPAP